MFFLHKKTCDTEKLVHRLHTEVLQIDFLHSETLPRTVFTLQKLIRTETFTHKKICTTVFTDRQFLHKKFSAQKSYAQKVLRTTTCFFFTYTRFYTQMSLHRHKLHTETCAHSTRLHTANFYTERLYFPFLITYLSCSPSQLPFATRAMIHLLSEMNHQVGTRMYIYIYICIYIYIYVYIYICIYIYIHMYYA